MDWLEEELRDNDRREFPERLARFKEIDDWFQVPEGGLSPGPDWENAIAFSEARFAYVNGFWLSAILMSLTALERHLAWRLASRGTPHTENLPAKKLIELSLRAAFITESQAAGIDGLREYRNAYAHFRIKSRYLRTLHA